MKLILVLWLAAAAPAQETAQLSGTVRDQAGWPVADATITAFHMGDGTRRSTRSAASGEYMLAGLRPGAYKVLVRKPGFQTIARLNLPLGAGEHPLLDFTLEIGSVRETITITAEAPPINSADGSAGGVVGRAWLDRLPLNAGTATAILDVMPGLIATPAASGEPGQFSTAGQRPNTNYFTVDGLSANTGVTGSGLPAQFGGASLPALTALGSTHNLAPLEAVQDVRVQTSTFAPEFGRMPGAQIAITTRSGSNQLHGSVYQALRHERLSAGDWFANAYGQKPGELRLSNTRASLGGPIARDRTFFFAGFEALRLRQPHVLRTAVPSIASRQAAPQPVRALLEAFPMPNGPEDAGGVAWFTATSSRPSSVTAGSLRIDHALTPALTVFARYNQAPSSASHGYAHLERAEFATSSVTVGATAILSPVLSYDFRINRTSAWAEADWTATGAGGAGPLNPEDLVRLPSGWRSDLYGFAIRGMQEIITGAGGRNRQGQWNLAGSVDRTAETHRLRIGLDYDRLTPSRDTRATSVAADYGTLAQVLAGQPPVVRYSEADQASALLEVLSVFGQDTWHVRPGTSLTYGARWEITPAPAIRGNVAGYLAVVTPTAGAVPGVNVPTALPRLWPTRYGQVAPRIGIAQRLGARAVVRAGWGLFYNVGFTAATDPINGYPFNRWQFRTGTGDAATVLAPTGRRLGQDLRLPYAHHWNVTVESPVGERDDIVSLGYVGSAGRSLLRREGSLNLSIRAADLVVATNHGESDYHALNLRYRRVVGRGMEAMAAYTWSHAIDNGSWDSSVWLAGDGVGSDRASASFDARHALTAAVSKAWRGWRFSGIGRARTGFPIDVLAADNPLGLGYDNMTRPDLRPDVPVWIRDRSVPGGRRLNRDAFALPKGIQGSLGRNAVRGFGMWQVDAALAREFDWIQVRLEAFNLLNHANFADPVRFLDSPLFGTSSSMLSRMLGSGSARSGLAPALQAGGPRSVQASLRFSF
jgi:hypothetical protein